MKPRKPKRPMRAVRRPVQARGIATVEALLEAAARILSTENFESFTTNRVAKVAGVGIGSLYEYFPDKREILAELTERLAATIKTRLTQVLRTQDGVDIGVALAAMMSTVVEIYNSRVELHRKLLEQTPHLPRANPLDMIEQPPREALVDMLRAHADEIIVTDYELAAINICRICRGMVEAVAIDPFMPLDLVTVETELVVICRRYLTGRP